MKYSHHNAAGATVHEVEARRRIDQVLRVDTETGEVVRVAQPPRADHEGNVATETERYRWIAPIFGGGDKPCLFHCYGRIA